MRKQLLTKVQSSLFVYKTKIQDWIKKSHFFKGKQAPILNIGIKEMIEYDSLKQQISCGPIFLNQWVDQDESSIQQIPDKVINDFISNLQTQLK